MKEPIKDDERLSAFLEGQLSGRERDEMLAHLDASDDDYEVLSDTTEVLLALEEEDARAAAPAADGVIPIRRSVRRWRVPARALALAASVAGVLLISTLVRRDRTAGALAPLQLAARVDSARQGLPGETLPQMPWFSERGDGDNIPERERAVRAGATLVDLSVAARAGDSVRTNQLAGRLRSQFDPYAGPRTPLQRIADRPKMPADSLERLLDRATDLLADRFGRKSLELGAWARAARMAADKEDAPFFQDSTLHRDMLLRAESLSRDDDDQAALKAVVQVREALAVLPANGAGPQWITLRESLDVLLRELAS